MRASRSPRFPFLCRCSSPDPTYFYASFVSPPTHPPTHPSKTKNGSWKSMATIKQPLYLWLRNGFLYRGIVRGRKVSLGERNLRGLLHYVPAVQDSGSTDGGGSLGQLSAFSGAPTCGPPPPPPPPPPPSRKRLRHILCCMLPSCVPRDSVLSLPTAFAISVRLLVLLCFNKEIIFTYIYIYIIFSRFYFPASGRAVVTGVVPAPPPLPPVFLPSIFIAHRVQQSHRPSTFHRALLTHALALSASRFVHEKKNPHECTRVHYSAGLELTKPTCARLEDTVT